MDILVAMIILNIMIGICNNAIIIYKKNLIDGIISLDEWDKIVEKFGGFDKEVK